MTCNALFVAVESFVRIASVRFIFAFTQPCLNAHERYSILEGSVISKACLSKINFIKKSAFPCDCSMSVIFLKKKFFLLITSFRFSGLRLKWIPFTFHLEELSMEKKDNVPKLLTTYLQKVGHKINERDLSLQLEGNPHYPSLRSITDTFDYFGVENVAAQIPVDAIDQMPENFLANILDEYGNSIVVEVVKKGNKLRITDGGDINGKMFANDFKIIWTGNVIAVEPNENSPELFSGQLQRHAPALSVVLLILMAYFQISEWTTAIYTFLATAGIYVSSLAVREELGLYSKLTAKVCNSSESNTNCSQVIASESASIFGVKLSDASMSFFAALLIIQALLGFNAFFFQVLAWMSLPVIIYSLYVQFIVQKTWCPICLGIGGILLVQSAIALFKEGIALENQSFDWLYLAQAMVVMGLTYFLWLNWSKLMRDLLASQVEQKEFVKFKRNPHIFDAALGRRKLGQYIPMVNRHELSFGNPDASLVITGVTNPYCGFCAASFRMYHQLLERFRDQIKVVLVFSVSLDPTQQDRRQISQRIIEEYHKNPHQAWELARKWYAEKDEKSWIEFAGAPIDNENTEILQAHVDWCKTHHVFGTPVTLLNNNYFPSEYDTSDLTYLVAEALEVEMEKQHEKTNYSVADQVES